MHSSVADAFIVSWGALFPSCPESDQLCCRPVLPPTEPKKQVPPEDPAPARQVTLQETQYASRRPVGGDAAGAMLW